MAFIFALTCMLSLVSCGGRGKNNTIEFTIPAGYNDAFAFSDEAIFPDAFIYSEEEISPKRKTLTIKAGAGYSSIPIILKPIDYREENAYEPILLTRDKPITIDVEKGAWFKIGVAIDNPADVPIAASIIVEDVDMRNEISFPEFSK